MVGIPEAKHAKGFPEVIFRHDQLTYTYATASGYALQGWLVALTERYDLQGLDGDYRGMEEVYGSLVMALYGVGSCDILCFNGENPTRKHCLFTLNGGVSYFHLNFPIQCWECWEETQLMTCGASTIRNAR